MANACKSRGRTELNKALKVERSEEVLRFDPTNGQSKLVGKELHENDVCELLAVFGAGPFIFFPFLEDFVEARRRSFVVDDLGILARDLEGFGDKIGNVFLNKHVRIQVCGIDLLGQICKR